MIASLSFCLCLDGKIRLILTSFLLFELSFVSYLLSIIKMFSRSFSYNNLNYFLIYIPLTSFLRLKAMLVFVPNNAGYNLLSTLLKFTHMQAEVMKLVIDVEPIPDIYKYNLQSSLYDCVSFLLFMFRWQD